MNDAPVPPAEVDMVPLQQSATAWSRMAGMIEATPDAPRADPLRAAPDVIDPEEERQDGSQLNFEALADPSVLPVTVYPFLRQVADRFSKHLSLDLRKKSGALIDIAVIDQVNMRMGNAIASIPVPSLIGVLRAEGQDAPVFAVVDGAMASLFFDMILGGAHIKPSVIQPVRNFSVIEQRLFHIFAESLAGVSNAAFAPVYPLQLKTDRVETNPRFLPGGKAQDSVIKIRFLVQCGQRSGFIDLYMPARFLAPIDAHLRPKQKAETIPVDPYWQRHFKRALLKSHVELWANLSDISIPLYRLRSLKVGDVLRLDKGPQSLIDLVIDHRVMARGRMGQSTGKIAIRVEDRLATSHQEDQ